MTVSWTASSDNVAVAGYIVYLDSRPVATTASTSSVLSGSDAERIT